MGKKRWIIVGLMVAAGFWGFPGGNAQGEALPAFSEPAHTAAVMTTDPQAEVEFPMVLRGTGLIAEHLAQYEGPFLEDEMQEPVSGVMALMVYNPGSQFVESVQLVLKQGEDRLVFEITFLPPRSRILVLEKSGHPYSEAPVTDCQCLDLAVSQGEAEAGIRVTEEVGQLVVSNLTQQEIADVTVYYKQYSEEGEFFLGGLTCSVRVTGLKAGENRRIQPYRYVQGYTRVVQVTAGA